MKLIKMGLVIALSAMLTACGGIAAYMDTSDEKLKGQGVTLSETVKTKDLYGAWMFSTDDTDPDDIMLIFAFYTDHTGLAYGLDVNRKTKAEHMSAEYFTWKLDETNKELHSVIFKQVDRKGDKRTEKTVNERDTHKVGLYRLDNQKFAITLDNKSQRMIFFRMPNDTYNDFIKLRPDLPRLK